MEAGGLVRVLGTASPTSTQRGCVAVTGCTMYAGTWYWLRNRHEQWVGRTHRWCLQGSGGLLWAIMSYGLRNMSLRYVTLTWA